MLRKNKKIIKYSCYISLFIIAGVLYSCNRVNEKSSDVYTTIEEDVDTENKVQAKEDLDSEAEGIIASKVETDYSLETRNEIEKSKNISIYVHVCGAVVNPGVYDVNSGTRVFEVIKMAGGITNEGADYALNQAELVEDGQKIYVPTIEEVETMDYEDDSASPGETSKSTLVNINKAGKEELMTLPGVGDSKAQSIISYREENDGFTAIEDIKNITGIKDGLFNKIKDYISVK